MSGRIRPLSERQKSMLLARCARLAYAAPTPLSQSEIAVALGGVDPSYVSRLLKEAREEKLVTFQVNLPKDTELECDLMNRYGLLHARVIRISDEPSEQQTRSDICVTNMLLGQAAAKYLEGRDSPLHDGTRVGISCGTTLLEMIMAFTRRRYRNLRVSPLTIEGLPGLVHQAPSTLVGLFKAKFPEGTEAYGPQFISAPSGMPRSDASTQFLDKIVETVRDWAICIDLAIVGIGEVNLRNPNLAYSQILWNAGVTEADLRKHDIVGEISNRPYNRHGGDVYDKIPALKEHTRALELSLLQKMVKEERLVLAVAGGKSKHEAIRVALESRYINGLVTDIETASYLCDSKQPALV